MKQRILYFLLFFLFTKVAETRTFSSHNSENTEVFLIIKKKTFSFINKQNKSSICTPSSLSKKVMTESMQSYNFLLQYI